GDRRAVARATEEGRNLLRPLERRVERPGPRNRVVRVRFVASPGVVEFQIFGDRRIDAVERYELGERAVHRSFRARTVVAADEDDERVVELAHMLYRLSVTADLV